MSSGLQESWNSQCSIVRQSSCFTANLQFCRSMYRSCSRNLWSADEVWCLLRTNATKNCRALVGKGLEPNHVLVCEVPTTLQSFCHCVQGMNQVNAANLSYFNKEEAPSTACLVFQHPKRAATDPGFEWLQITLKINVGLGRPPVKMDMWQWKGYTRSSTTPASGSYLCALQCAGVERAGFCSVIDSSDPLPRYLAIHPSAPLAKSDL